MTKRLFWLNGIAILSVVLNHAVGWGFTALFWWTDRYRAVSVPNFDALGTPTYDVMLVIKQLTPFSVPVFLVVSGYFIAFASRAGLSWKMVGARLKGLLIPYLIWSLVAMALDVAFGARIIPIQVALNLLTGNATSIYYYVPLICQLFVLSPLLVPWIRSAHWKKVLLAAGVLQLVMMGVTYLSIFGHFRFDAAWFFGNLVFFFVFGVALNFHLEEIKAWIHCTRFFWLVGLVVFGVLAVVETEIYFRLDLGDWRGGVETLAAMLYTLSFVMVFIEFERFEIPYSQVLGKIGQKAYGIYLLHPIVLLLAAKLTYHLAPRILGWPGVFLPLLLVTGIALPLLAMRVVARTPLRKAYRFLFG